MKTINRIYKCVICMFTVFFYITPTNHIRAELPIPATNSCTVWSLSSDIRLYPDQENPNRDSCGNLNVWYFMGSHTVDHDPQGYYLLPNFSFETKNVSGLQSWQGDNTEPTIPPNTKLPLIGMNTTDLPQPNWPVNAIVVHPWKNTGMVIVGWRSPFNGVISIDGMVRDTDSGGGDGVDWFIDKGADTLADGGIYDGGSQSFSEGTGGTALQSITIKQGEFVYFLIAPKANDGQDTTQLDILVTLEHNTCEIPFFSQVDENWQKHPLRGSCSGWCIDPQVGFVTIGRCGCTLTSAAMVFNTYGAYTDPAQLSDCMGTSACAYAWPAGASCSQNKARWISRPDFDWNVLDQQLNQYHRPVILGTHRKGNPDATHWVVILSGQGDNPQNYRIHDPAFKCGANISLSTRFQDYDFDYLGIYEGQVPCSSLLTLTPPCVSRGANPQPVITSTMNLNTPLYDTSMASPSVISGTVWLYTMTEITMTVEITATSSVGTIEEMLIWSDSMSNTTWQPFTPFVWLPVSEFVYAQFKDNLGNVTGIYSDTIYPSGPPTGPVPLQVFLPLVIRQ